MIPTDDNNILDFEIVEHGNKSWSMNNGENIDDIESLRQSIECILSTERYKYPIYSWDYGIELDDLIGRNYNYVIVELERRIRDALSTDDRVESIDNFYFEKLNKKSILVTFTVNSVIEIKKEMEVL